MSFLMRVELPDVPGSLGRLATAIGEAGGDIEAIEIVEKRFDGTALDDVLLDMEPGVMPDSVVSACNAVEGVRVVWVSRYAAGGNLFLDLEAVEDLTAEPAAAMDRLVHLLPVTFRADWAARVNRVDGIVTHTEAAPSDLPFLDIVGTERLESLEEGSPDVVIAARLGGNDIVIVGRRGGPAFLDSELARVGHLAGLAVSIARP
ncbi:amino acid-binding protein [Nocardioides bruguierae]|uniref:amino acid-binding protein n=1 Tax=Nocardioides bruguierae TaxID=2945102 RepID=UPI0020213FD9|nr:amino acid-binding protein [Nocardioides bruguierae]MCL8025436.1 amino acid-binding protein [Nocardioides bruguierae]